MSIRPHKKIANDTTTWRRSRGARAMDPTNELSKTTTSGAVMRIWDGFSLAAALRRSRHRDMSLNARSGVASWETLVLRTPSVSLLTMQEATGTEAVADFARQVLDGTGWELARVRRRFSRLEPPHSYWVVFEITIKKGEEEEKFRLVARGALAAPYFRPLKTL